MKIIKCALAVILTILMAMVDVTIVLIGVGVGLFDGLINFNWQMGSIWDFVKDRGQYYSELWDMALR